LVVFLKRNLLILKLQLNFPKKTPTKTCLLFLTVTNLKVWIGRRSSHWFVNFDWSSFLARCVRMYELFAVHRQRLQSTTKKLKLLCCVFSLPEHEVLKWAFVILQCPASLVRACVCPSVRPSTISLNNISSETAYWILIKLHRNDPWVVYQSCSNRSSWLHK